MGEWGAIFQEASRASSNISGKFMGGKFHFLPR